MRWVAKISLIGFLTLCSLPAAYATDLIQAYQDALTSDPVYQQAISQRLSTREGVPISIASILPAISLSANPNITRTAYAGSNLGGVVALYPRNNTAQNYDLALVATQTVFNYASFANIAGQLAAAKGADAQLNSALQNLMTRVATAYFQVLQDEDNLSYTEASKLNYAQQLDQVNQQYQVGIKTITDVYTAQASYDSAVAQYIAAQTQLHNDRENLRVITGKFYPHISSLSEQFPLISPRPTEIERWVFVSKMQNWNIKVSEYNVDTALEVMHQQFAGHMPTVSLQGTLDRQYFNNLNSYNTIVTRNGPSTQTDRQVMVNINVPLFAGGGVVAQTNQAAYNYQVAQQQLEQTVRGTVNTTRQSYLNIISGISKIKADKQAIKSNVSSLEGMQASYKVGTETLVDVLNQQEKLFQAQTQYATDRYAFVNNVIALKQSAGTLSFDDMRAINAWLIDSNPKSVYVSRIPRKTKVMRYPSPAPAPKQCGVSLNKAPAKTPAASAKIATRANANSARAKIKPVPAKIAAHVKAILAPASVSAHHQLMAARGNRANQRGSHSKIGKVQVIKSTAFVTAHNHHHIKPKPHYAAHAKKPLTHVAMQRTNRTKKA